MKQNRIIVTISVLILCTSLMIGSVLAGFPGANGKIAFVRGSGYQSEIWSVNPDGSDELQLTFNGNMNAQPAWSPDGSKIVFVQFIRDQESDTNATIWVMNADGSGQTQLTTEAQGDSKTPGWAPNGSMIVFARYTEAESESDIWVMNADGSNQHLLLDTDTNVYSPAWAPNGTLIAFAGIPPTGGPPQIFVMNADGSNPTQLTQGDVNLHPDWHPNSSGLVFTRMYTDSSNRDVWGIYSDGSAELMLVDLNEEDVHPSVAPEGNALVFGSLGNKWDLWIADEDENLIQITDDDMDSWCPDWQPIFGVGGDIIANSLLQVLTPYLVIIVVAIGAIGLLRKKAIL